MRPLHKRTLTFKSAHIWGTTRLPTNVLPMLEAHGTSRTGGSVRMKSSAKRRFMQIAVCTLVFCLLADWAVLSLPAHAAQHSIASVSIYKSRGFMYAEAWFEDTGPSTSRVSLWIDAYQAATGAFLDSYGRRDGTSSCGGAGARCSMLLKTNVQAQWGECYVARALSVPAGGGWVAASDPPRDLFCA